MLRRGDSCLELAGSVLMLAQVQVQVQALAGEEQGPASGMEPG